MTRILLRTPKGPFDVRSAETTFARNLVASNSGNLLFLGAAWKLLAAPGVDLDPDRLRVRARGADTINERYDHYVVPLANAFRLGFEDTLVRLTRLIRRLRIPVTVLGVGAQAPVDGELGSLAPMRRTVQDFVAAVLERSPAIGVRGELTAEYLAGLGFRDVEVIGCPSMFTWGPALPVPRRVSELDASSRVAVTITTHRPAMGRIALATLARYPRLAYIAQDVETLGLLIDGTPLPGGTPDDPLPLHPAHPLFRERRARFYLDPWTWIRDLRSMDFVFGTRIHGTIAGVLAGTPSVLLAHDSRTLELARTFEIPHRLLRDVPASVDPAWLDREADAGPMRAGHAARYATFTAFLARAGLDHVFAHEGAAEAFDARVAATRYPPAVRPRAPEWPWLDAGHAGRRVRAWVRHQGGRREVRAARVRVRELVG